MKIITFLSAIFFIIILGCKTEPKPSLEQQKPEETILEKIANAHGFENWNSVKEISFTFNVDRDSTHFERSWNWKPKSNDITIVFDGDTISYNRKSMDSIALKANGGFINDRYWILAPFNLIWDSNNFTYTHSNAQKAPISGKSMQKLTIVYANEGGYTPGDAYDFYVDDNFIIREWVYRKANQENPSMTTTWEDYVEIEGLKLVRDHRKEEPGFSLNFTNLSVTKD